jgi:hypothetical protein
MKNHISAATVATATAPIARTRRAPLSIAVFRSAPPPPANGRCTQAAISPQASNARSRSGILPGTGSTFYFGPRQPPEAGGIGRNGLEPCATATGEGSPRNSPVDSRVASRRRAGPSEAEAIYEHAVGHSDTERRSARKVRVLFAADPAAVPIFPSAPRGPWGSRVVGA